LAYFLVMSVASSAEEEEPRQHDQDEDGQGEQHTSEDEAGHAEPLS